MALYFVASDCLACGEETSSVSETPANPAVLCARCSAKVALDAAAREARHWLGVRLAPIEHR